MSLLRLVLRSLAFYRRTGIVIILGLAVAVAVITGSLLVGTSVTGSLRDTALSHLGEITWAITPPHYFRQALARELTATGKVGNAVPLLLTAGTAQSDDAAVVIPKVRIIGVDASFASCFPEKLVTLQGTSAPSLSGETVFINAALAHDLNVHLGDALSINIDRGSTIPGDTLFARWKRKDTLRTLRVQIGAVLPDTGMGGFSLDAGTATPRNLFIDLAALQAALKKNEQVNALVLCASPAISADDITQTLHAHCQLADYGLKTVLQRQSGSLSLESDGLLLEHATVEAAQTVAPLCQAHAAPTSIYLATEIATTTHRCAYALVATPAPLLPQEVTARIAPLNNNEIWLSRWTADDLHAHAGDRVRVAYLIPNRDGTFHTAATQLMVSRIYEMNDRLADRGTAPELDGITNTRSMSDWSTPFPIDLHRITPRDEAYWAQYRTTPKALISQSTVQKMWADNGSDNWVTSVRILPDFANDLDKTAQSFSATLASNLAPESAGLLPHPVRKIVLEAAQGATDFGQLFLGMSFFLMLAAAGLAGMLMRLLAERRATEIGILQACGLDRTTVALVVRGEGFALTVLGSLIGVPLGILYAEGTLHALSSWWSGAVGNSTLWLHGDIASPLIGALSGLVIGHLALGWGTRQLQREPLLRLLAGWQAMSVTPSPRGRRIAIITLIAAGIIAVGSLLYAAHAGSEAAVEAFFGVGAALLLAGLCGGYLGLERSAGNGGVPTLWRLAWRSAAANRGRSLLTIGLLAAATFIIIAVAANARDFSHLDAHDRHAGTGGFALQAESALPLHIDFSTPAGRKNLGFSTEDEQLFAGVTITPFLLSPGDDISCLNLAHPHAPRMLGVSPAMIARGGFTVQQAVAESGNPWELLHGTVAPADHRADSRPLIPIFGDADSVRWSLHADLGERYILSPDEQKLPGVFQGLISGSIFAGELLVSEENFKQIYPTISSPRYFLIDTPPGREAEVAAALRRNLGEMGLEVRDTRELLNAYIGVQNTYLSTFLALGGLGLLLGTLGMVMVLLRGALERRREFALMLAMGFRREEITTLLIRENAGLLIAGLLLGAIAALVAVIPELRSAETQMNWMALVVVLVATLAVGLSACVIAARAATRGAVLDGLRGE